MKNMFVIVLCATLCGCEAVATLFHGEKPEPPAVTFTVTFDANGAAGNSPAEQTVNAGAVISLPNIGGMASAGNKFVGWSESATIGVGTTYFVEDSIAVTRNMVFYAQWIANAAQQYTITFNANGASGAPPASKIVYAGVQIVIPDKGTLAYAGKMFGGWNTEEDGTGTLLGAGSLYTVSGSITLYAQWFSSTDSFTVTFHANGGSGAAPSPRTVNANSNIELPSGGGLSKDGFIFGGWNTSAAGTGSNYAAGYLYTVTGTITLYAKWNSFFASVAEVSAYLASQSGGYDPDEPIYLPVQINLGNMTQNGSGWRQLLNIIASSGRYVDLDLSACTMTGTEFNPDGTVATGKDKIVSITLPNTATGIGIGAFASYTNLTQISIPTGLTTIYSDAFSGCTNLALTELPTGITSIGRGAFRSCTNLALTELPAGITSIGENAFSGCTNLALTSLPTGLTSIEYGTFSGCMSLALTSLPAGLKTIARDAFADCTSLTSLTLSASVNINTNPFLGCTSLASFTVTGSGPLSVIEGGKALVQNGTELVSYPAASDNVTLPSGLTSIGEYTFYKCTGLTQITLPAGITSIGNFAFYECKGLTQITLPAGITRMRNNLFGVCINLVLVICPVTTPPVLENYVFLYSPPSLQIKVPAASVEAYKAAWSNYADRISAIE